jgi:hypothetical protein
MKTTVATQFRQALAVVATGALLAGCADETPLALEQPSELSAHFASQSGAEEAMAIATLRRATARYHNLDAALEDGFILLSECEVLPGHGAAGLLYANLDRVMDGVIDSEQPEGLLYEPRSDGPPRLVAVDLAVPYALWMDPAPPEFLGVTFQNEDEFGAWALHVWIWRHNPDGMFAPVNPNVTC